MGRSLLASCSDFHARYMRVPQHSSHQLFAALQTNGYHFIYLSSRSIGQASLTRDYLQRLHVDGHKLPLGPVIISPDGLVPSLYREMVVKRPHEFKIRCVAVISYSVDAPDICCADESLRVDANAFEAF